MFEWEILRKLRYTIQLDIYPQIYAYILPSMIRQVQWLVSLSEGYEHHRKCIINDDESDLHQDYELWLEKLALEKPYSQYKHNGYEDNADAHLKRTVMGREVLVAITGGKLDFDTWEQIFYYELDGKRQ